MATLQELESALRAADAAGNVEDATALANAYREMQAQQNAIVPNAEPDGPLAYGVDLAQERVGKAFKAVGELTGFEGLEQTGQNIVDQQQEDIARGNYQPEYNLTIDQAYRQGKLGGFTLEKLQENFASTGGSLVGAAGSALAFAFSMPITAAVATLGTLGFGISQNIGEAVSEQEAKLDGEYSPGTAVAVGTVAGMLDLVGAKGVIPTDALAKMTINEIIETLGKKGYYEAATEFTKKILKKTGIEGATEGAQAGLITAGAAYEGADYTTEEVIRNLGTETYFGAIMGGGVATTLEGAKGVKAVADPVIEPVVAKLTPDTMRNIHGGDTEAMADVTRDIVQMDSVNPERSTGNLQDNEATIDDLHTDYMAEFNERIAQARKAGKINDGNRAAVNAAAKRAKNKVKNESNTADIELLNDIDPQLGALARKFNIITRFSKLGVQGGVSQYTDFFNPLTVLRSVGKLARRQAAIQAGVSTGIAMYAPAGSASLYVGGRAIDAVTGSRNRVKKAIKKYGEAPGIARPDGVSATEATAGSTTTTQQTAYGGKPVTEALDETKQNIAPDPISPQGVMEGNTGLDRATVAKLLRILAKAKPALNKSIQEYHRSVAMRGGKVTGLYPLIEEVKRAAGAQGIEYDTTSPSYPIGPEGDIRNPIAYQATVDAAMATLKNAVDNAPTPEIAAVALKVAAAKSRINKKGIVATAINEYPDHVNYIKAVIDPLTEFGPQETAQESRFDIGNRMLSRVFKSADLVEESRTIDPRKTKFHDVDRLGLIARALGKGFKVALNASDDAYYRRQELITLSRDAGRTAVLHEIFHAVENRLSEKEMSILQSHPVYRQIQSEVVELYPELTIAAQRLEAMAETAARLQNSRTEGDSVVNYVLSRIKGLIEAFKNLIDGKGFRTVDSVLDEIYTGKAYQRGINEAYDNMLVPTVQHSKSDKPGGPMVAKRLKLLDKVEQQAKELPTLEPKVNAAFDAKVATIANNLGIPGIDATTLNMILRRITPGVDIGMIATDYLRSINVLDAEGRIIGEDVTKDNYEDFINPHRDNFIMLLKALQEADIIGEFGLAFRTSAGGRLYPVHTLDFKDPDIAAKAELNNVNKFKNRAKSEPYTDAQINDHPLGSYENTREFILREQQQGLVINDKIFEMMDKMQSTPQTHRGLDLIFKKDGTTDSAYTLASAEAIKQHKDNQKETGMSPVFMRRRAQDRLRVDTLNGSASYQGKAGKAIWEFPNWTPLGATGFEQMLHSMRDHFGLSNELPFDQRVGVLFGTVRDYMKLAGRPESDKIPENVLDMPLIDYIVNQYGQDGSYIYSHTRGGTPKIFLDKQSGTTLYQMNHAVFDVADHGFEIQRAAIELGRMRAFLEGKNPKYKKVPSSELFQLDDAQAELEGFRSAYPTWFDGTSSSYQLHAVLTGDAGLAAATNLTDFDPAAPASDLYRPGANVVQGMYQLPFSKARKISKKFLANRRSYGQVKLTAQKSGAEELAKQVEDFGDYDSDQAVKDVVKNIQNQLELEFDTNFPGAALAEGISRAIAGEVQNMLGDDGFAVRVPLPDGDIAVYTGKLPDSAKRRVTWTLDENGKDGTERRVGVGVYQPKLAITGFAAFLNHALDAYVQREMAKRLRDSGVEHFMHTHDAFAVPAANAEQMRQVYHEVLTEIAKQDIYAKILEANGLDPDSMVVKFNKTTEQGPVKIEIPMRQVLETIHKEKMKTFGDGVDVNFYALS